MEKEYEVYSIGSYEVKYFTDVEVYPYQLCIEGVPEDIEGKVKALYFKEEEIKQLKEVCELVLKDLEKRSSLLGGGLLE